MIPARGVLPNVFIPGAQKAGTSSLVRYLDSHPQCAVSVPKEPSFFCRRAIASDLNQYRRYFEHIHVHDQVAPKVVIDASTAYMCDTAVPRRILDELGSNVKFIFILREPAVRAVSSYWHVQKRGSEARSLSEVFDVGSADLSHAVEKESEEIHKALRMGRIDVEEFRPLYDDYLWPFRHLANSRYLDLIHRYEQSFGRENILIILLEQLERDPISTFRRLTEFLDVDSAFVPPNLGAVYNRTVLRREGVLPAALRLLGNVTTHRHRFSFINKLIHRLAFRYRIGDDTAIQSIRSLFAEHDKTLAKHLSLDLDQWWHGKTPGRAGQ